MRAALRDAKIAAAKARGEVKPTTTLAQRRAARRAEKYEGWHYIRVTAEPTVAGPLPPERPLPRDHRGRVPRFSTEGMATFKKPHSGAVRGGRPKYRPAPDEQQRAA